ncbi:MAG: hypothetical protein ACYC3F_09625 [Gemmatimonadaceae bacterium]
MAQTAERSSERQDRLVTARRHVGVALASVHADVLYRLNVKKAHDKALVVAQLRRALSDGGAEFLKAWIASFPAHEQAVSYAIKALSEDKCSPDDADYETRTLLGSLLGVSVMVADHAFGEFFYAGMHCPVLTREHADDIMDSVFVPLGSGSVGFAYSQHGASPVRTVASTLLELRGKVGIEDLAGGNLSVQMVPLVLSDSTAPNVFGVMFFFVPIPGFFSVQQSHGGSLTVLEQACADTARSHAAGLYGLVSAAREMEFSKRTASLIGESRANLVAGARDPAPHAQFLKSVMPSRAEYEPFGAVIGLAFGLQNGIYLPTALVADRRYVEARLGEATDAQVGGFRATTQNSPSADGVGRSLLDRCTPVELSAEPIAKIVLHLRQSDHKRLNTHALRAALAQLVQALIAPLRAWSTKSSSLMGELINTATAFLTDSGEPERKTQRVEFHRTFEKLRTLSDASGAYCDEICRAIADGPSTDLGRLRSRVTALFEVLERWAGTDQQSAAAVVDAVTGVQQILQNALLYPQQTRDAVAERDREQSPDTLMAVSMWHEDKLRVRLQRAPATGQPRLRAAINAHLDNKGAYDRLERVAAILAALHQVVPLEKRIPEVLGIVASSQRDRSREADDSLGTLFELLGFCEELEIVARSAGVGSECKCAYRLTHRENEELVAVLGLDCDDGTCSAELHGRVALDKRIAAVCINEVSLDYMLTDEVERLRKSGAGCRPASIHPSDVEDELTGYVFDTTSEIGLLVSGVTAAADLPSKHAVGIGTGQMRPEEVFVFGLPSRHPVGASRTCEVIRHVRHALLHATNATASAARASTGKTLVHHLDSQFTLIKLLSDGMSQAMDAWKESGAPPTESEVRALVGMFARPLADAAAKIDRVSTKLNQRSSDGVPTQRWTGRTAVYEALGSVHDLLASEALLRARYPNRKWRSWWTTHILGALQPNFNTSDPAENLSTWLATHAADFTQWKALADLDEASSAFERFGVTLRCTVDDGPGWPDILDALTVSELIQNAFKGAAKAKRLSAGRHCCGIEINIGARNVSFANSATQSDAQRFLNAGSAAEAHGGYGAGALWASWTGNEIVAEPTTFVRQPTAGNDEPWVRWTLSWS